MRRVFLYLVGAVSLLLLLPVALYIGPNTVLFLWVTFVGFPKVMQLEEQFIVQPGETEVTFRYGTSGMRQGVDELRLRVVGPLEVDDEERLVLKSAGSSEETLVIDQRSCGDLDVDCRNSMLSRSSKVVVRNNGADPALVTVELELEEDEGIESSSLFDLSVTTKP